MRLLSALLGCAVGASASAGSLPFALTASVDDATGSFVVSVDGQPWFGSSGAGVMLRHAGKEYSTDDGGLAVVAVARSTGRDAWGAFEEAAITYSTADLPSKRSDDATVGGSGDDMAPRLLVGSVRTYAQAVIFEQLVATDLSGCATGDANAVGTKTAGRRPSSHAPASSRSVHMSTATAHPHHAHTTSTTSLLRRW